MFDAVSSITSGQWIYGGILVAAIMGIVLLGEVIFKFIPGGKRFSRKFVHIGVGIFVGLLPFLNLPGNLVIVIGVFFILANFSALQVNLFKGIHNETDSWGTVFFPISFTLLCLVSLDNPLLVTLPMFAMALGDGFSALVGENSANPKRLFREIEGKSVQGSAALAVISLFILIAFAWIKHLPYSPLLVIMIILGAVVITLSEAVSWRGSDNLSVPLFTWIILRLMLEGNFEIVLLAALFAAIVSIGAYRLKALSQSGAVATFLLGFLIFSVGGIPWSATMLTFFIFSSLLSKIPKKKEIMERVFERGSRREASQVLANGGVPGVMLILYWLTGDSLYFDLNIIALAGAAADTWATELGGRYGADRPLHLRLLRKVPAGTSGAVSIVGFLASFLGGSIIGLVGGLWTDMPWYYAGIGGLVVSLLDSFLGAYLQKQYICPECGELSEVPFHCGKEIPSGEKKSPGFRWLNNNRVNILSIILGCFIFCCTFL